MALLSKTFNTLNNEESSGTLVWTGGDGICAVEGNFGSNAKVFVEVQKESGDWVMLGDRELQKPGQILFTADNNSTLRITKKGGHRTPNITAHIDAVV